MTNSLIPFNKPFIAGKELYYIAQAVTYGNIAGDGHFTQECTRFLEKEFGIQKTLLTPSCTAALEMAVILCDLQPGDEVILPSYTFVSTASSIVRVGAIPVFVDIRPDTLNLDEKLVEAAITDRTKAIFPVHYAGVGCEMECLMSIAEQYNLKVVEDAAQGVSSYYNGQALGSIGHLGTYSFHETKNYISGEGGALCINDPELIERAEIIRDKGTNRQKFYRGEVDKYTWVDHGSSYVPSEIVSAFLYGQLEMIEGISKRRKEIFQNYQQALNPLAEKGYLQLPFTPEHCQSNYHMFYILLPDGKTRDELMFYLKDQGITAVFHYVPLHSSPMGKKVSQTHGSMEVTDDISSRLLRLPFYYEITDAQQEYIQNHIKEFLTKRFKNNPNALAETSRSAEK
jgi:dTDP-4-amino-4,6-dideoxygalactose transaminase